MPIALDDNITVPATAGAVLWLASLMTALAWAANRDAVVASLAPALAVNTVAALGGWRAAHRAPVGDARRAGRSASPCTPGWAGAAG